MLENEVGRLFLPKTQNSEHLVPQKRAGFVGKKKPAARFLL